MRTHHATAALLLAAPLFCQSNAVPGLDAQVYNVGDVGSFGRRGAVFPNGEAGFGVGHSYCNSGTVNIPWVAYGGGSTMLDTYPKIAFMLARESNGRLVQISGRSHAKHSRAVFNFSSGPCAPCVNTGGQFMFIGCSDTYGSGTNVNRFNLGPTTEIDPWLGTWNSIGSYFDRGDPAVVGAAATDAVQSLSSAQISAFDAIKNMVEVRESELAGGGNFFGQVHLMIVGEPVGNRANNVMSRPCTISWSGTSWSSGATGTSTQGSVLNQWQGATVQTGGNGPDDGRFAVGVKVTGPIGGLWHYEYAVHNLDNSRGGAALRIPVDAAATVQNAGFHDIDADALNQWTFARTGTEIAFTAAATNPIEWNTLYNFWFDCSVAPSFGQVLIDEARIGAGALQVGVQSEVPSGIPSARAQTVGTSCGSCASSFYEFFPSAGGFDLANSSLTMTLSNGLYTVGSGTSAFVPPTGTALTLTDDSTATVPVLFNLAYPGGTTSSLEVCSNGFISVGAANGNTFSPSVPALLSGSPRWAAAWHDLNPGVGGQVIVDSSPAALHVTWLNVPNYSVGGPNTFQFQFLPSGTVHIVWQAMTPAGNAYLAGYSPGGSASDPGNRDLSATLSVPFTLCSGTYTGLTLSASDRPILGTSITMTINDVPAGSAFAALLLSTTQAVPPIDLTPAGMNGCFAHVVGGWNYFYLAPATSVPTVLAVPNDPYFIGAVVTTQGFSYSPPLTPMGAIASNGQVLTLGL